MSKVEGSPRFIYLPGAGGGREDDLAALADGLHRPFHFETIEYPGWRRYVEDDFSAEALIAELTAQVVKKVPTGPIRLMGLSIGGHFGYAVALRLQAMGREISVFCAIDSFMVASSAPSAGWQVRAVAECLEVVKRRRFEDLAQFVQSKFWRALFRLAGGRLTGPLRKLSRKESPALFSADGIAEQELSLRLLLRAVAPWLAELDRDPVHLTAPAILLRTQPTANSDEAWRKRCPNIVIREVPGKHRTLFAPENIADLRAAYVAAADQLAVEHPLLIK